MDNLTVDLGPGEPPPRGSGVVLIGRQDGERILAEELAQRLGTITYEVTCGISARVPRVHIGTAGVATAGDEQEGGRA